MSSKSTQPPALKAKPSKTTPDSFVANRPLNIYIGPMPARYEEQFPYSMVLHMSFIGFDDGPDKNTINVYKNRWNGRTGNFPKNTVYGWIKNLQDNYGNFGGLFNDK